jgi:mannitol/fructose-specific phosphotransferase system IIA component (Ntr-type)
MMTLADFTTPDLIIPRLRSRDASELTAELCLTLEQQGRFSDRSAFYDAVIRRESLSSTAMLFGWALSYARLANIPQLCFALGRTAEPVSWFGGQSVNTIILFAVPEAEAAAYLNLLSGVAKLSQHGACLGQLTSAPDGQAMFEVLQSFPIPKTRAVLVN